VKYADREMMHTAKDYFVPYQVQANGRFARDTANGILIPMTRIVA
jgi:hypothetical protein